MSVLLASLCCCTPPCGDGCVTSPMLMTSTYSFADENNSIVCTGAFADVLRFNPEMSSPQVPFVCVWDNAAAHVDDWEVFQNLSCLGTCEIPYMRWFGFFGGQQGAGVQMRVVVNEVKYLIQVPLTNDQIGPGGCPIDAAGEFGPFAPVFSCTGGGQFGTTTANSGTWDVVT